MAHNQNSGVAPIIKMDSRKFMSALNDSAQAKVAFFEERVQQLGQQANKNWRLAALHAQNLFIEDVDTHEYFIAKHNRDNGRVSITDISPIQIVEGQKKELFAEAAYKLVTAIESNDQKEMASAFSRLQSQRFSSRVVPNSGIIKSRDGVVRHINITNEDSLSEETRTKLVAAIVEGLQDRVIIEDGQVVAGYFDQEKVQLPVTKWATRKLVARRMRDTAADAFWSEGFQSRIGNLAKLVSEGKIEEAVKSVSGFLDEMEEFCLLSRKQTQTLIENALAAKTIFNQQLCDDTATLFYRTNLRVNKRKIIDEWRNIAKKAAHPVLAENVQILEASKNFEASYDKFLYLVFEAISNREVAAEALATTLNVLRDKTPKIKESHDLSSKLNGLINRLKQRDFDDAAIYEAEDLIATIQEELGASDTLNNFDQMPGNAPAVPDPMGGMDTGEMGGGSGTPVININSPLIQIGGSSSATPGGATPPAGGATPPAGGGDPELEALLGGSGAPPQGGQQSPPMGGQQQPPPMGGQQQPPPIMQGFDREGDLLAENDDPYAIRKGETVYTESVGFFDYGSPVITSDSDLSKISQIMQKLAVEHKLTGNALNENLHDMAKASIKVIGLRIPQNKMNAAVEQSIKRFMEEWEKPWLKKKSSKPENEEEGDEEGEEEGFAEDQYKIPLRKPHGLGKSGYSREMGKGKKTSSENRLNYRQAIAEGITWKESQDDAIRGEFAGVNFIFDHGGANPSLTPVVVSEDGAVEIPIPPTLYEEAFAAANMTEGDGTRFMKWLFESIEQLRPLSRSEEAMIDEAAATITVDPDGRISVNVSDDVEVGSTDDEMGGDADDGLHGEMPMGGEMGDEMDDGMAPVDVTDPNAVTDVADGGDEMAPDAMPDFEDGGEDLGSEMGGEMGGSQPSSGKPPMVNDEEDEDEDDMHFEDRDITAPPSSKFTTHVGDNKRKTPEVKLPGKTNDRLDSIGPELKVDDGSGTKPPTARKGSDD